VVSFLLSSPPISNHSCYMACPSYPPWLHHSNYTWWSATLRNVTGHIRFQCSCKLLPSDWDFRFLPAVTIKEMYWCFHESLVATRSAYSCQPTRSYVPEENTRLVSMTAETSQRSGRTRHRSCLQSDAHIVTDHIINAPPPPNRRNFFIAFLQSTHLYRE
jgi:hypothetical protein